MAKSKSSKNVQIVYSEKLRIKSKKRYLTKSIEKKVLNGELTRKQALAKYGKFRYTINPNAKPIKCITHD